MNKAFLFTGPETFLINEQVQVWRREFIKKYGDLNISFFEATTTSLKEIISECYIVPFLSEKKIVFIENYHTAKKVLKDDKLVQNDEKKILELIKNPPETAVVVFINAKPDKRTSVYKTWQKHAEVKFFDYLSPRDLLNWVFNEVQNHNSTISREHANYLIRQVGTNMWQLKQEIRKLATYKDQITKTEIDLLVQPNIEISIFTFIDALAKCNQAQAIKLLTDLVKSGESVSQIFYMIIRQWRILLQVKSNGLAKCPVKISLNPYVLKIAQKQAQAFSLDILKKTYKKLLEIDIRLKTGGFKYTTENQGEFIQEIEMFIMKNC